MAKNKTKEKSPDLIIDEKEYFTADMADDQKVLLAHIRDLDRKVESTKFNLQQLQIGQAAFVNALRKSLSEDKDKDEAN